MAFGNQLKTFTFPVTETAVRVVEGGDGEPRFVASDVAKVLGYSRPNDAVRAHCKAASGTTVNHRTAPGSTTVTIIPERDVYRLVMRSKLPEAEKFEEWVVGEVLPSLRKNGSYSIQQGPQLPDFNDPAEAARAWARQYEGRVAAEQREAKLLERQENVPVDTYRTLHIGGYWTHSAKVSMGHRASQLCKKRGIERGVETRRITKPDGTVREGTVYVYPRSVLDEAYRELFD